MKHFVNESSDMGFSLEVFPMGGVHNEYQNEYQRPTKKKSVPLYSGTEAGPYPRTRSKF